MQISQGKTAIFMYAAVLFVGDSHSYQSFGHKLDALLRTIPQAQVASYASWGSSPADWFSGWITEHGFFEHDPDGKTVDQQTAPTPLFGDLVARFHPSLTIIALGSNLYTAPENDVVTSVRKMTGAIKTNTPTPGACLWVGPPDMRSRSGPQMVSLFGWLKTAIGTDCRLLDSRDWTHYPATGGDGIHYDYLGPEGFQQAESWAEKVFAAAQGLLKTP